jgi:hypothetical protein
MVAMKRQARRRLFLLAGLVERVGFGVLTGLGGMRMLSSTSLETPSSLAAVVAALVGD